jgi:hypothetical protein
LSNANGTKNMIDGEFSAFECKPTFHSQTLERIENILSIPVPKNTCTAIFLLKILAAHLKFMSATEKKVYQQ